MAGARSVPGSDVTATTDALRQQLREDDRDASHRTIDRAIPTAGRLDPIRVVACLAVVAMVELAVGRWWPIPLLVVVVGVSAAVGLSTLQRRRARRRAWRPLGHLAALFFEAKAARDGGEAIACYERLQAVADDSGQANRRRAQAIELLARWAGRRVSAEYSARAYADAVDAVQRDRVPVGAGEPLLRVIETTVGPPWWVDIPPADVVRQARRIVGRDPSAGAAYRTVLASLIASLEQRRQKLAATIAELARGKGTDAGSEARARLADLEVLDEILEDASGALALRAEVIANLIDAALEPGHLQDLQPALALAEVLVSRRRVPWSAMQQLRGALERAAGGGADTGDAALARTLLARVGR